MALLSYLSNPFSVTNYLESKNNPNEKLRLKLNQFISVKIIFSEFVLPTINGSKIDYWEQKSQHSTHICLEKHCINTDLDLGIVEVDGDFKKFIIPLCKKHLKIEKTIEIPQRFRKKLVDLDDYSHF